MILIKRMFKLAWSKLFKKPYLIEDSDECKQQLILYKSHIPNEDLVGKTACNVILYGFDYLHDNMNTVGTINVGELSDKVMSIRKELNII